MSDKSTVFVRSLVEAFPGLGPAFDEHLSDNFEEVLPHIFLGDVTRYVVDLFTNQETAAADELRDLLRYLEWTYAQGDEQLQELISVSFLENLPRADEPGGGIRRILGPTLSQQLDIIG